VALTPPRAFHRLGRACMQEPSMGG
jgi:hypothetical protein